MIHRVRTPCQVFPGFFRQQSAGERGRARLKSCRVPPPPSPVLFSRLFRRSAWLSAFRRPTFRPERRKPPHAVFMAHDGFHGKELERFNTAGSVGMLTFPLVFAKITLTERSGTVFPSPGVSRAARSILRDTHQGASHTTIGQGSVGGSTGS